MEVEGVAAGSIGNPMDLKEIFYTNLLLLGFDAEAQEAKYRIPFNSDMFLYPNKKAMEVVLHFLFCKLDAPLAFQEFRDCWPVRDKKMEQEFRKSCNSWLTKISKEEPDSNLPRIGPTLFLSPGGDKFYEVMFYFSSYVLRKVMVRDHSHGKERAVPHMCKRIVRMPNMNSISSKAVLVKMLAEKNRFFENVQCDLKVQEHWKSHAMSSTKEYRKLCKESRELERKLNPTGDNVYLKEKTDYVEEAEALRRTKQLQEVREHWSVLETFHENTKEKRAILDEILENSEPNFHLDGSLIQLQIPDVLTTKYRHAIQMKNIKNTYEEGKLNMLSLVQLSNLSLHELKERIRQDGIPDFEQFIPYVKHEVRTHGTYLAQTQNLRMLLKNDLIPELKKSIDQLKEECYAFLDETVHSPVVSLESFDFGLGLLPTTPSPAFITSGHLTHSASRMPEISLKKTPKSQATPDVIENLTSSIREMVIRGNQQPDENQFQSEVLSARTFDTRETTKPFVSKIPKPVNRRLSQTPDVTTNKSMAVRRRSLTTTKKPKRTRGDGVKMEKVDTKKGFPNTGVTGLKDGSQRKVVGENKLHVTNTNTNTSDDQFRTPLATGTKSAFMKQHSSARNILAEKVTNTNTSDDQFRTPLATGTKSALNMKQHSSARNILAEKIAAAVFSDEPSSRAGSSQSSSGENTPKDLAIADPLGNLMEEPFISKDLIPRTPFKRDEFFVDPNDDDALGSSMKSIVGSMKSQATGHNITTTNKHCPSADATFLLESPLLKSDTTIMNSDVSQGNTKLPIRYSQQNSPDGRVMSPFGNLTSCRVQVSPSPVVSFEDLVLIRDHSNSVSSSAVAGSTKTVHTTATSGTTHISSDIILQYQRLKKAQEANGLLQNNSPQTPEIFTRPTIGNGGNLATVSGGEASSPRPQSPSVSSSYIMPPSRTTNPALLQYQQWKKVQEVSASSGTAVTSPHPQSTDVMVSGASLTPEIKSHNLLQGYQVGSQAGDVTRPRSTDIMASGASHALEVTSHNLLLGNQVGAHVSSPSPQSPAVKVDDMLTPFMNGHHGLLRDPKRELTLVTDDVISDVDDIISDITQSHQPATHVTYSKGFATPMMSSMGNHFYEFGQTPLEHIAPPMDFSGNSLHCEGRESVRSRLSFDFDTPGSSLRTSLAQQGYLNTPSAREIASMKKDDVIGQREFNLIPVNTDDLFQDDYRLPFEENIGDFKKDIEPENVKEERSSSSVENTDTTEVSIDSTPHVEVGQLIEFD